MPINLLMQFQADITEKTGCATISKLKLQGLGAAYLAGLATGYWKDKKRHYKKFNNREKV